MSNWIQEAIFYQIYPLGFCGCEQFQGVEEHHRLHCIEEWIPHMKQMHINALYLGPVFSSYEHGYDTSDYFKLDSRLGNNEEFHQLCDKLHQAGIRIVLDGVFNHVGRNFWAFQDVKKHMETSAYRDWFHNIDFSQNSPYQDGFSYEAWEGHYNLVKLNLKNEEVIQHLLDAVAMWMEEFHIDGLRLDAADCVDKDFFRRLKTFCKQKDPDFWLMGEIIHGDYNMWANDEMLDSVTNYECYKGLYSSHNEKNYFEIAYSLNRQFGNGGIYKHLTLYSFADNHDVNRLASTIKRKKDLLNVYSLLFTMPGIPSVYYGSEWGIEGTKHDGSDADIRPHLCIQDQIENELYLHICSLAAIHEEVPALSYGSYEQILVKNEQFVFKRTHEDTQVLIALNVSENEEEITVPSPYAQVLDLLSGKAMRADGEQLTLKLAAQSSMILVRNNSMEEPELDLEIEKETEMEELLGCDKTIEEKEEIADLKPLTKVIPGRYRHYKGRDYAVLYLATHSETLEEYVVYRQLYGEGEVWIRPLAMFMETVEADGKTVPRFSYLGK